MRKKKSKLQKKKDNPRSKYWENKADEVWGELVHTLYNHCLINEDCAGNLEAHHLISRANKMTRHKIENAVLLCSKHHKFCNKLSAHGAPLAFSEFLQEKHLHIWEWCSEHKYETGKPDYQAAYQELKQKLEALGE